jgi:hypothetical protein
MKWIYDTPGPIKHPEKTLGNNSITVVAPTPVAKDIPISVQYTDEIPYPTKHIITATQTHDSNSSLYPTQNLGDWVDLQHFK